jgi:hypothetical protein
MWTYSGVRPLFDDGASAAQEATRDYVLKVDGDSATRCSDQRVRRQADHVAAAGGIGAGEDRRVLIGKKGAAWTKTGTPARWRFRTPEAFEAEVRRLGHGLCRAAARDAAADDAALRHAGAGAAGRARLALKSLASTSGLGPLCGRGGLPGCQMNGRGRRRMCCGGGPKLGLRVERRTRRGAGGVSGGQGRLNFSLLPLREKVPEGWMRGLFLAPGMR